MAWTNEQKKIAAIAAREAKISDEHRKLILGRFDGRAFFDRYGNQTESASSTSKQLTNADFEQFMACVEQVAGGKLSRWSQRYWQTKSITGPTDRLRHLARRIVETLTISFDAERKRLLEPKGVGLAGWVDRMFADKRFDELNERELSKLIESLKAYGERHGVIWNQPKEHMLNAITATDAKNFFRHCGYRYEVS